VGSSRTYPPPRAHSSFRSRSRAAARLGARQLALLEEERA
jgi:hypothetical protein